MVDAIALILLFIFLLIMLIINPTRSEDVV